MLSPTYTEAADIGQSKHDSSSCAVVLLAHRIYSPLSKGRMCRHSNCWMKHTHTSALILLVLWQSVMATCWKCMLMSWTCSLFIQQFWLKQEAGNSLIMNVCHVMIFSHVPKNLFHLSFKLPSMQRGTVEVRLKLWRETCEVETQRQRQVHAGVLETTGSCCS